ncbi:MAG TPA: hypothetical protein VHB98_17980, partial [Chloroflexota bacterium]|nr:hypothetical protein [Chloroflexota bacterium]
LATIASTAAYGPINLPAEQRFVVLMVLNKPSTQFGSETAAPAVHSILQLLFNYYHRLPNQPYWQDQSPLVQPSALCAGPLPAN